MFFLGWAIPLTRVAMRVMLVSHGGGYVREDVQDEASLGNE